ncbi:MAG: D-glycero-beta-D-manno-heptose 1-phosphate adenylyltransferase [Leptospiraceae bacterium]|nr:D-glycero-beta-D-manno-heptose 1-phosphate adenylyltransferase [Leptospiraceae bacterium]
MQVPLELKKKFIERSSIQDFKNHLKDKKIIFTNGCFDLVHPGHIDYLIRARNLGDFLWIGLNSDVSVKRLKGETRPINGELSRAIVLMSFFFVDAVTIFKEDTPIQLIKEIAPNVHTKGGDYKKESLPEYETIKSYGGDIQILPFLQGESSTKIIEKIQGKIA